MSMYATLDHVAHAKLKVKTRYGETYGDNINQALVFPTEFQALQREYPIFFRQLDKQTFYSVVILGLDRDENLFLESNQWSARYIPAMQMRGPFALSIRQAREGGAEKPDPLIQINLDDDRVNEEYGERIFLPHGGYSPFLEEMLKVLQRIHIGSEIANDFFSILQSFDLIEPISVQANYSENVKYTIPDLFTISQSRMKSLTADELHELSRLGLLEHCFAVLSSTGNMSRIVDMKISKKDQIV